MNDDFAAGLIIGASIMFAAGIALLWVWSI